MNVCNLFAGPGAGKSTTAAGLFYEMKRAGMSVELVTEYAKDKTWEEHSSILEDQLYILAKQNRRISRLRGKVDWVITDGPILQGLVYTRPDYYAGFAPLVEEIWNSYNNINFLVHRNDKLEYQAAGRNQSAAQAISTDHLVKFMLDARGVPYTPVEINDDTVRNIMLIAKLTA